MKKPLARTLIWSATILAVGFVTPSVVLLAVAVIVGQVDVLSASQDIWQRQFAEGHNLFSIAALGLIPFFVLSLILCVRTKKQSSFQQTCAAVGGLVGILGLMVPAHISVWYPLYGPGHASSTAVLAFLFVPFYCLASMALGLAVGNFVSTSGADEKTA